MKRDTRLVICVFLAVLPGTGRVSTATSNLQLPTPKEILSGDRGESRRGFDGCNADCPDASSHAPWELGVGSWELDEPQQPAKSPDSVGDLEAAIKKDPTNPDLYVALGLAYFDRNDSARALDAFQRAVKMNPRSAEAHNWLGVALSDKSDLPGAIAAFKKAIALDPKYGRAYTNLGSALATSGDLTQAVQVFEKALALEPDSLGAHRNLGIALRETGDFDRALEELRGVASAQPENAAIQYEVGQTLRQRGDMAGAVTFFEKALQIDPELREAYYALGVALKQQGASALKTRSKAAGPGDESYVRAQEASARGELAAARDHLAEAIRQDEKHAEAHNLLGFIVGQQGDLAAAVAHFERSIAINPALPETHYNLGVALWYRGSKDRSIAELRESVRLDPAAGTSHAFLGTALRETGDLAGARISLQRAIALLPPSAAVYIDLAITYLRAGEPDKALGQLEAALNAPATSVPAPDWDGAIKALGQVPAAQSSAVAERHNVLGLLLGRTGADSGRVAAEFREAIRLRPDFAEAHNNVGLVLIQAGDDPAGIASLREAVRLRPDFADAHANLGAALTPTDAAEAIRELEKAVALAPTSVKAQFNLAVAYGASPDRGASGEIEQLRKVIELAPAFARAHLALGKALLRDSKVPDAIGALQEATRLEPGSGEAHYQLGLALARAGRKDEASAELLKGRQLISADDRNQNAALDIADGRAALERGDSEEAAAKFRHALELRPDSAEARRLLASVPGTARAGSDDPKRVSEVEAFIRQGQYKEAEPLLTEYVKERPQSSWAWYALGYSFFGQQRIGESIKALAKSLELDVKNAEAHKILGRDLMIIGRFDAAQTEFEQAIRYKPDSAESHYNLGKLFSIQDNWEPARKALEAALRVDPSYIEALDALGFAQEALGDDREAVASYEKAAALNDARGGSFTSAHVNLSAYYNRTGDPDKALVYALKAIELDPKSDRAWFQKGRADERQGRLEAAVEALNQATVYNSRASSYYYVLAGVYRRLGWMDESRQALDAFKRLEQESAELEKKRRSAGSTPSKPIRD
jgi:tetratricopeptide (TPR) repeat protein